MMPIEIHQCRPINYTFPWVAWLIMLFQKMLPWDPDSYSHLAGSFHSETGAKKSFDSTSKSVRDMLHTRFLKKYHIVKTKKIHIECTRKEFLKWLEEHEGKDYDNGQIKGLALKAIGLLTFNKYGSDYRKMTCNEVILSLLERFKTRTFGDPDNYDLLSTWKEVEKV